VEKYLKKLKILWAEQPPKMQKTLLIGTGFIVAAIVIRLVVG